MQPYYEERNITIYHADARDILSWITADVVLTDTPYGIDGARGNINKARGKGNYGDDFPDNRPYIENVIVPIMRQLIDTVPCVVVTPGSKNMDLYPRADSFGCFYQPASAGLQVFGNMDAQPILYYGKNALGRNMGVPCSYQLTEAPPKLGHPCAKPFRAWRRLLSNIAKPGMTVLDPFMGSGTTLRAAKDLGMKAIGIDITERWCEVAARYLSQEVMEFV
jgi:DNA modification methylase